MTQREFPTQPLIGVGGVVFDDLDRVLLVRRAREPLLGHWSLPGGLLELGETLVEGVRREVAEETGLIVEPRAIVEAVDCIYRYDSFERRNSGPELQISGPQVPQIRYHYVIVDYWCRLTGGDFRPSSDASQVAWVSRVEWNDRNFYSLESITMQVIKKGWRMAKEANGNA